MTMPVHSSTDEQLNTEQTKILTAALSLLSPIKFDERLALEIRNRLINAIQQLKQNELTPELVHHNAQGVIKHNIKPMLNNKNLVLSFLEDGSVQVEHSEYLRVMKHIDALRTKIDGIEHKWDKARDEAQTLLGKLDAYASEYNKQLLTLPSEAMADFQNKCLWAVSDHMPTLEKDLGWGDYLLNLLKNLANGALHVLTLGQNPNKFFTPVRAKSAEAVEAYSDIVCTY